MLGTLLETAFTRVWRFPEPQKPKPALAMVVMIDLQSNGTVLVTTSGSLPAYRTALPDNRPSTFKCDGDHWLIQAWTDLGMSYQKTEEFHVAVALGTCKLEKSRSVYLRMQLKQVRSLPHLNSIQQQAIAIAQKQPVWKDYLGSQQEPFFGSGNSLFSLLMKAR